MFSDMNFRNHIPRFPAFRFALCFVLYPVLSPISSWAATDWSDDIPYFVLSTELPEVRDSLLNANIDLAKQAGVDDFRLDTFEHIEPIPGWSTVAVHAPRPAKTSFCGLSIGAE